MCLSIKKSKKFLFLRSFLGLLLILMSFFMCVLLMSNARNYVLNITTALILSIVIIVSFIIKDSKNILARKYDKEISKYTSYKEVKVILESRIS